MKTRNIFKFLNYILIITAFIACKEEGFEKKLKSGDLIFQTSMSKQSKAIQIATQSKYSHVGIVYVAKKNEIYVYEAAQKVQLTPLQKFIEQGENGYFVVKRLKNVDKYFTNRNKIKTALIGKKYIGKDYDIYFEWSDDKMYCSELVWKMYKESLDIEIGELKPLSEFNLKHEAVQKILKERYGDSIPLNEKIISPAEMFNSDKLETIFTNWE